MRIAALDDYSMQSEAGVPGPHVCRTLMPRVQQRQGDQPGLERESFDMLIIDWQLPDLAAADVVRWARERLLADLPVLFITGRSNEDDIVAGCRAGADDYMIKPLRRGELVARVQALLRRAYPTQNGAEQMQFGPYVFEPAPGA